MDAHAFDLTRFPVHLGLGGSALREPRFDGDPAWYAGYGVRHGADGVDGRLVTMHRFRQPWSTWEMHPQGAELVICIAGSMRLVQEIDGERRELLLEAGMAAINPPGVWHTADVDAEATGLFVTAGLGTEVRPR